MLWQTLWHLPFLLVDPYFGPAEPLASAELRLGSAPVRFFGDYSALPGRGFFDTWALRLVPRNAPPVPITEAWSNQAQGFSGFGGHFSRKAGPLDILADYAYLKNSLDTSKQMGFAWASGKLGHLGLIAGSDFFHGQAGLRWRAAEGVAWFSQGEGAEDWGLKAFLGPVYASAELVADTPVYETGLKVWGAEIGIQRWGQTLLPSLYLAGNWLWAGWRRLPGQRSWWLGARVLWGPAELRAFAIDGKPGAGLAASDTLKWLFYQCFARSWGGDTLKAEARLKGGPLLRLFGGDVLLLGFGELWEREGRWFSAGAGGLFYRVLYLEVAYDSLWTGQGWRFGAWVKFLD